MNNLHGNDHYHLDRAHDMLEGLDSEDLHEAQEVEDTSTEELPDLDQTSTTLCREEDQIQYLQKRLERRNAIIDDVRKAYYRDVILVQHELLKQQQDGELYIAARQLTSVPSIDLKNSLALFSPHECHLKLDPDPCTSCGGSIEIIHHESHVLAQCREDMESSQKAEAAQKTIIHRLREEIDVKDEIEQALRHSLKALTKENSYMVAQLKKETVKTRDAKATITKLQVKVRDVSKQLEEAKVYKTKLKQLEPEFAQLEKDHEQLKSGQLNLELSIKATKDRLSEETTLRLKLERNLAEKVQSLEEAHALIVSQAEEMTDLREDLNVETARSKDRQTAILETQEKLAVLEKQLEAGKRRYDDQMEENEKLMDDMREKTVALKQQLKQTKKELAQEQEKFAKEEAKCAELTSRVADMQFNERGFKNEAKNQKIEFQIRAKRWDAELERWKMLQQDLETQLIEQHLGSGQAKSCLALAEDPGEDPTQEIKTLHQELKLTQTRVKTMTIRLKESNQEIEELREKIDTFKAKKDDIAKSKKKDSSESSEKTEQTNEQLEKLQMTLEREQKLRLGCKEALELLQTTVFHSREQCRDQFEEYVALQTRANAPAPLTKKPSTRGFRKSAKQSKESTQRREDIRKELELEQKAKQEVQQWKYFAELVQLEFETMDNDKLSMQTKYDALVDVCTQQEKQGVTSSQQRKDMETQLKAVQEINLANLQKCRKLEHMCEELENNEQVQSDSLTKMTAMYDCAVAKRDQVMKKLELESKAMLETQAKVQELGADIQRLEGEVEALVASRRLVEREIREIHEKEDRRLATNVHVGTQMHPVMTETSAQTDAWKPRELTVRKHNSALSRPRTRGQQSIVTPVIMLDSELAKEPLNNFGLAKNHPSLPLMKMLRLNGHNGEQPSRVHSAPAPNPTPTPAPSSHSHPSTFIALPRVVMKSSPRCQSPLPSAWAVSNDAQHTTNSNNPSSSNTNQETAELLFL